MNRADSRALTGFWPEQRKEPGGLFLVGGLAAITALVVCLRLLIGSLGLGETSLASLRWLGLTNELCSLGVGVALGALMLHGRQQARLRAGAAAGANPLATATLALLVLALAAMGWSVWNRYLEVNHFPSQTMSEVLNMFSLALLCSMLVLHFALNLGRLGPGWAIVNDALLGLVFLGVWLTNHYSTTLSTAQRDLPPALQSYWFPPHLVALIFSYATLGIAGLVAVVYFTIRFWSGIFSGGRSWRSQLLVLALLTLLPYGQLVTGPVLLLVGLVFLTLRFSGWLPGPQALASMERTMDEVSYRAFCVGIPFLTAGLFMGAFWAQEAWANYWGWDSKENSALITWLVYVVYIHLRMLGGYRGEKAMAVLLGGALSVFITFQVFGYLPDSQKSLHRYTDDGVVPREGMQGARASDDSARLPDEQDD
jgi:cytochrome c-type biogenesis protein CcsB